MTMSPGTYLATRRQAAGLSIEDVALRIEASPYPMALRDRVEWLKRIEEDVQPITLGIGSALLKLFRFDPMVLVDLGLIHAGQPRAEPRLCRQCGCSWNDACVAEGEYGCFWVGEDLCSACVSDMPALINPRPAGAAA